jgi:hypothetical protein
MTGHADLGRSSSGTRETIPSVRRTHPMLLRSGPMEVVLHTLPSESPLGIRQNRVVQESKTLGGRRAPSRRFSPGWCRLLGRGASRPCAPVFRCIVSTALHHKQMKRRYSRPAKLRVAPAVIPARVL